MAYPAVNSLIQTLELFPTNFPALIHGQAADMIDSLLLTAKYFQRFLENTSQHKPYEYENIKYLEGEMRAAVQQAEDELESNIAEIMRQRWDNQLQQEMNNWTTQDEARILLRDNMRQAMDSIDRVRNDLAQIGSTSTNTHEYSTAEHHFVKSREPVDITVGLDNALTKITNRLLGSASDERKVVAITGMGGSGKTTLAKEVQRHTSIKSRFDIHAWVTISHEYRLRDVFQSLEYSIIGEEADLTDPSFSFQGSSGTEIQTISDDKLMENVYRALKGRRYLIVVDDIWSTDIWDVLMRIFPDDNNGSRIILTTRLQDVAKYANPDSSPHEVRPLSSDQSWKLLCKKLFGAQHNCPSDLEVVGKKIVEKCQGLPLAIMVVAGHLSNIVMTKESWNAVANNVSKVVTSYPDECEAILAMSYHHLPIHLKHCFLHMGSFPEDHKIDSWKLIRLWVAEGIIKSHKLRSLEDVAEDCLEDLASRNLIMVKRKKYDGGIKFCGMHDLLRDLSVSEAEKEKFLDVVRTNQVPNPEARRLVLHSHMPLQNITNSSRLRSLYIIKQDDEPPGETLEFNALRVLAVIPVKFRHHMTLDSAMLRYLEVRGNNALTRPLIGDLYNLQTFIYVKLEPLEVPSEIWNLKQLRHAHFKPSIYLANPQSMEGSNSDLGLQHLQEISWLCFDSCTKEVLSCLPSLNKLRIDSLKDLDKGITSGSLLNLVYLNNLESLFLGFEWLEPLWLPLDEWCSFPISLKRLTIYNGQLPWEDMATLAKLPNLQVLKLVEGACKGSVWRLNDEDEFKQLKFLKLERTDLKRWEASSVNFPNLQRLVFRKINTLKQIPSDFAEICTLELIELDYCDCQDLEKSAREIQEEAAAVAGMDCLHVHVYDSS